MSATNTYHRTIKRKKDELNRLQSQRAKELNKVASLRKKILSAKNSLQRTKSMSIIQIKTKEIQNVRWDTSRGYA
jgi:hypothetical protein